MFGIPHGTLSAFLAIATFVVLSLVAVILLLACHWIIPLFFIGIMIVGLTVLITMAIFEIDP